MIYYFKYDNIVSLMIVYIHKAVLYSKCKKPTKFIKTITPKRYQESGYA